MGAGVPCARTKSAAHQRVPDHSQHEECAANGTQDDRGETLVRASATMACGIPTPTTVGTNSVKRPVFSALEAVLIAAAMVLPAAIEASISC